jgi:predicted Kef-type K+ transport protein
MALGGILAMSSTALLSKMLAERGELDAPHGREVIGVLLFQDIAVVPLLMRDAGALAAGARRWPRRCGWRRSRPPCCSPWCCSSASA